MAASFKSSFIAPCSNETLTSNAYLGLRSSSGYLQFKEPNSKDFIRNSSLVSDHKGSNKASSDFSVHAQASFCVSRALKWWVKNLKPNMIEIHSAQQLVDSISNAGDRLVIVDFYSPGCGVCKSLHPKICQLAESNPNAVFLKVNYEELKTMCYSLHIHVLPFFRFYRGAEGKLCSFSCTNATIKKFKDSLAKYGSDHRCSLGPAKGLDESELLSLASIGEISLILPSREETEKDLLLNGKHLYDNMGKSSIRWG
ncbi:hypothetical protein LguiA_028250 [Lonicera macranthoides]